MYLQIGGQEPGVQLCRKGSGVWLFAWVFSWCTLAVYRFYLLPTYRTVPEAGCYRHKCGMFEKQREAEEMLCVSMGEPMLTCPGGRWGDTARGSLVHMQRDGRALGGGGGGCECPVGVLYLAGERERSRKKEHLTVWLVSQEVLGLL